MNHWRVLVASCRNSNLNYLKQKGNILALTKCETNFRHGLRIVENPQIKSVAIPEKGTMDGWKAKHKCPPHNASKKRNWTMAEALILNCTWVMYSPENLIKTIHYLSRKKNIKVWIKSYQILVIPRLREIHFGPMNQWGNNSPNYIIMEATRTK